MPQSRRAIFWIVATGCFAAVLYARVGLLNYFESQENLPRYVDRMGVAAGTVTGDPDARAAGTRVTIAVETVNGTSARGTLLAILPPGADVRYGDRISVRGLIEAPQSFAT